MYEQLYYTLKEKVKIKKINKKNLISNINLIYILKNLILWVNLCVTFEYVCFCRFEGIKVTCCISWMLVTLVMLTGFALFIRPLHRIRRTWPPFRYDKMPQPDNHRDLFTLSQIHCVLPTKELYLSDLFGTLYIHKKCVHQSMSV